MSDETAFDFENWEVESAMPAWLKERVLAGLESTLVSFAELEIDCPSYTLDEWLHVVRMPERDK